MKRTRTINVCGWKAVEAVFARNPDCVLRLFFDPEHGKRAGAYSRYLAKHKRIYRQVEPAELEKVAGTVHHGGIVAVTEREAPLTPRLEQVRRWASQGRPLLVLDRISNHHNLGAIVRTAAFFGVENLVYGHSRGQALPSDATYRVAEGGMEFVQLWEVERLAVFLRAIRPFYRTIGTVMSGEPLDWQDERLRGGKPVALVLGNEESGLSRAVANACDRCLTIRGSGQIESLNVSAANAILVAWLTSGGLH